MRSPAAAVAWEFRRQHRWGFLVLTAYFALLAILRPAVTIDSGETFALFVATPLTSMFLYFLGVFTFGLAGDIGARQSIYPRRLFTLPMTTAELAGWPMLYGGIAMALLWFATRFLGVWPSGVLIPVFWPAVLGASLLAWTQALTWMPYPLPGMRVAVTIFWLCTIDAIAMVALHYRAGELVMLALVAPHLPLAYAVARYALGRARRGDVPNWRGERVAVRSHARPFCSASRAQLWLEWRQHGRSLPVLVAILLPFEVGMFFVFRETPVIVIETLIMILITPPVMAAFVAATVSTSNSFMTTRPMTDGALIGAKLKVTVWSTVASWLLVIAVVPLALRLSGTTYAAADFAQTVVEIFGRQRAAVLSLVVFALLVASTWKQLVQSLYIGLSGREWLVKTSLFATLGLLAVVLPLGHWAFHTPRVFAFLWYAIPWIAAVLATIKVILAMRIGVPLRRALIWSGLVFALFGVLVWIFPDIVLRHYLLMYFSILMVPLVRLSAAPLALAWNRHR